MARGGARNRSGPQHDPKSLRTAERGIVLTALPSEGHSGEVPEFPLPRRSVYYVVDKVRVFDEDATASTAERERELWAWAWTTPQAVAWSLEPWRWPVVAMWVRTYVVCEGSEATAADKGSLHRFADQIGMTPAGLKENGWAIARNEVAAKREERQAAPKKATARDRMKVIKGGDGA